MKMYKTLCVATAVLGLAACSGGTANCSSTETQELVFDITKDELANLYGQETANAFSFSLDMIRTLTRDEDVGYFECAADLTFTVENESESAPIEYTVTQTDDKKHFYVEVFGL